jgi:hypothetical protein
MEELEDLVLQRKLNEPHILTLIETELLEDTDPPLMEVREMIIDEYKHVSDL